MSFEVLPPIPLGDFDTLKLERLVADVDDAAIDKALTNLAERNTAYDPEEGRAAAEGDLVTMNFVGRIDGEAFEGGSGEGPSLVIGKKQFIPGFEEGVVASRPVMRRSSRRPSRTTTRWRALAAKTADFDVKVRTVAKPKKPGGRRRFRQGPWRGKSRNASRVRLRADQA